MALNQHDRVTVGIIAALMGVALFFYSLRAYSASKKAGKWRADFLWVSVAVAIGLGCFADLTITLVHGLGHHEVDLTYTQIQASIKGFFAFLLMNLSASAAARLSVVSLIVSIQDPSHKNRVRFLWAIGAAQVLVNLGLQIMILLSCNPIQKTWNPLMEGDCSVRSKSATYGLFQGVFAGLVDCVLALWPLTMIHHLKVARGAKLGFCFLIGIGIIPGLVSIYRGILTHQIIFSPDVIYSYVDLMLWSAIEFWLIIALGSISTLRPLFMHVFYGKTGSNAQPSGSNNAMFKSMGPTGRTFTVIDGNAPVPEADEEEDKTSQNEKSASKVKAEERLSQRLSGKYSNPTPGIVVETAVTVSRV
ncbi:hypothetical protein ANO11243_066260 [Dothideomycetidae sp. 11243]|nr:hypothetical protein ANO11243_066260 [fungal sp. No.11243]